MIDQQAVPLSKRRLAVIWIITCGGSTLLAGLLGLMATLLYVIIIEVSRAAEVPRLVIAVGGYVGLGVGLLAGCHPESEIGCRRGRETVRRRESKTVCRRESETVRRRESETVRRRGSGCHPESDTETSQEPPELGEAQRGT